VVEGTVFALGTGGSLSNITVTGGMGIQVAERSAPRISHCTIEGNPGAGITCGEGSSPNIADCTIRWNGSYMQGGGVVCERASAPVLERCRILANVGGMGGGVACRPESSPVLRQCIVSGNLANNQRGGGLFFDSSSRATLTNCLIMGNRSDFGSALYCQDASPVLWNCTIAGNAELNGQVSVAGRLEDPGASVPVFTNCVLPDIWQDGDGNAYWLDDHSCYPDGSFVKEGVFDFDRFSTVDLGDRTWSFPDFVVEEPGFHLQAGSTCIDAGLYPGSPVTDLDGHARPCGNGVDIGAYESGDCNVRSVAFRRGDADASGSTDVTDAIVILGFLYLGDPGELPCRRSADTDENAEIEITDAISLLEWLFLGGPPPGVPVEACGFGARPEVLSCDSYPPCN
jgi:parallel beta-helix repeat protein